MLKTWSCGEYQRRALNDKQQSQYGEKLNRWRLWFSCCMTWYLQNPDRTPFVSQYFGHLSTVCLSIHGPDPLESVLPNHGLQQTYIDPRPLYANIHWPKASGCKNYLDHINFLMQVHSLKQLFLTGPPLASSKLPWNSWENAWKATSGSCWICWLECTLA